MQKGTRRSPQVSKQIMATGSASFPPRLASDTFRDCMLEEHCSGPASTANYHQSRGLIKVWLSSECSGGYAERGIGRGPTQDHTVSVRGRRCEIGLLAIINLWPEVSRRMVNSAAGKKKSHSREVKTVLLDVRCGQEKWDALSLERLSLMRSTRDWMNRWRFVCTEQNEQRGTRPTQSTFVLMTARTWKVLFMSLQLPLCRGKSCTARKTASLWELSCRYGMGTGFFCPLKGSSRPACSTFGEKALVQFAKCLLSTPVLVNLT